MRTVKSSSGTQDHGSISNHCLTGVRNIYVSCCARWRAVTDDLVQILKVGYDHDFEYVATAYTRTNGQTSIKVWRTKLRMCLARLEFDASLHLCLMNRSHYACIYAAACMEYFRKWLRSRLASESSWQNYADVLRQRRFAWHLAWYRTALSFSIHDDSGYRVCYTVLSPPTLGIYRRQNGNYIPARITESLLKFEPQISNCKSMLDGCLATIRTSAVARVTAYKAHLRQCLREFMDESTIAM